MSFGDFYDSLPVVLNVNDFEIGDYEARLTSVRISNDYPLSASFIFTITKSVDHPEFVGEHGMKYFMLTDREGIEQRIATEQFKNLNKNLIGDKLTTSSTWEEDIKPMLEALTDVPLLVNVSQSHSKNSDRVFTNLNIKKNPDLQSHSDVNVKKGKNK